MLNQIVLTGRLTKEPELRRTQSGTPVASFSLAVDRDFKNQSGEKETDFFNCVAWNKTGEFVNSYLEKGNLATVVGTLQNRAWTDDNGNKRISTEIRVDNVYPSEWKKREETAGYQTAANPGGFTMMDDTGDDLPF